MQPKRMSGFYWFGGLLMVGCLLLVAWAAHMPGFNGYFAWYGTLMITAVVVPLYWAIVLLFTGRRWLQIAGGAVLLILAVIWVGSKVSDARAQYRLEHQGLYIDWSDATPLPLGTLDSLRFDIPAHQGAVKNYSFTAPQSGTLELVVQGASVYVYIYAKDGRDISLSDWQHPTQHTAEVHAGEVYHILIHDWNNSVVSTTDIIQIKAILHPS